MVQKPDPIRKKRPEPGVSQLQALPRGKRAKTRCSPEAQDSWLATCSDPVATRRYDRGSRRARERTSPDRSLQPSSRPAPAPFPPPTAGSSHCHCQVQVLTGGRGPEPGGVKENAKRISKKRRCALLPGCILPYIYGAEEGEALPVRPIPHPFACQLRSALVGSLPNPLLPSHWYWPLSYLPIRGRRLAVHLLSSLTRFACMPA